MKYKVKSLVERYTAIISRWEGVECITLNEAALPDVLDPYFALILDVFCSGDIPPSAERLASYGEAAVFETSGSKDRFLAGEIPVRFEFKNTHKTDELAGRAAAKDVSGLRKDAGTYDFYRLTEGEILFSRHDWIQNLRKRLKTLGSGFWKGTREASQAKMEHFLSDLGAAFLQNDDFFYLVSAAGFVKSACLTLFCINRKFEPSNRQYYRQVLELPTLPASFPAQLETFLRNDAESNAERRYAAAQLIARGIVSL
jgi:hypothetical protein